jgi:predicted permease
MPDWTPDIRRRLAPLRLSPAREAEIVEELSQHLDDRWREAIAAGASREDAAALALAEFADETRLSRYMAPLRQSHVPPPIAPGAPATRLSADLWRDVRYAVRAMVAAPGFTAIAVLSLALGIGADTAIFSLWNGVLHAALPGVAAPGQLVILSNPDERGSWTGSLEGVRAWLTHEEFVDLRDHAGVFSSLMASQSSLWTWHVRIDDGAPEEARGRLVSGRFFEVLGVGAAIGRVFTSAEDRVPTPTAVISHSYWQRRFGGRADVLGKTLGMRGAALTIIGVAPRGFVGESSGQQPDVWVPLGMQRAVVPGRDRLHDTPPNKVMWLHVFGRLTPGVTMAQAEARANAVFQAGLESFYGAAASGERRRELLNQRLELRPGGSGASAARPAFSQSLTVLLAAVGVLLLIACANLANLLLARGAARTPEFALRLSLGASRGRLIRQLLTEGLALAVAGTVAAMAVAPLIHAALVRMMADSDPSFHQPFTLDPVVLAFVLAATGAATLLFATLPAWHVTRTDAAASLRHLGRGAGGSGGSSRTGRLLVAVQLALSLPLLVGAGLLARTAYNLQRADLGYPARDLLLVRVDLREASDDTTGRAGLRRELLAEIRRTPGIRAASFSHLGLFSGGESTTTIEVEGYTHGTGDERESAVDFVGPGYFAALGVPIVLGRDILESDDEGSPRICVINEAFASRFFKDRNPIGMTVTMITESSRVPRRVVGVVGNGRMQSLRGDVEPRYFVPSAHRADSALAPTFLIRPVDGTAAAIAGVRRTIQRVDPAIPILSARSIEEQVAPLTAQDRHTAQLAVVFGCVALALAAIGLYGVLSYGVARRTGEIAIRIALGARASRVIGMILRETMAIVGVGLAVGAVLAFAASRLIGSRLYGVASNDPLTLTAATALLLLVAMGAAFLPARRASRLDPMVALHQS